MKKFTLTNGTTTTLGSSKNTNNEGVKTMNISIVDLRGISTKTISELKVLIKEVKIDNEFVKAVLGDRYVSVSKLNKDLMIEVLTAYHDNFKVTEKATSKLESDIKKAVKTSTSVKGFKTESINVFAEETDKKILEMDQLVIEVVENRTKVYLYKKDGSVRALDKEKRAEMFDAGKISAVRLLANNNALVVENLDVKDVIKNKSVAASVIRKLNNKSKTMVHSLVVETGSDPARENVDTFKVGIQPKQSNLLSEKGLISFTSHTFTTNVCTYVFDENKPFTKDLLTFKFKDGAAIDTLLVPALSGEIVIVKTKKQACGHDVFIKVYKNGERRYLSVNKLAYVSESLAVQIDELRSKSLIYKYFSHTPSGVRQAQFDAMLIEENGKLVRTEDDIENIYIEMSHGAYKYIRRSYMEALSLGKDVQSIAASGATRLNKGIAPSSLFGRLNSFAFLIGKVEVQDLSEDGKILITSSAISKLVEERFGYAISSKAIDGLGFQVRPGMVKAFATTVSENNMKTWFYMLAKEVIYVNNNSKELEELMDKIDRDKKAFEGKMVVVLNGTTKEEFKAPDALADLNAMKTWVTREDALDLYVLDMPKEDYSFKIKTSKMMVEKLLINNVEYGTMFIEALVNKTIEEISGVFNSEKRVLTPEEINKGFGAAKAIAPEVMNEESAYAISALDAIRQGIARKISKCSFEIKGSFRRSDACPSIKLAKAGIIRRDQVLLGFGEIYLPGYEKFASQLYGEKNDSTRNKAIIMRYPCPETAGFLPVTIVSRDEMMARIDALNLNDAESKALKDYYRNLSHGIVVFDGSEKTAAILGGMDYDFDGVEVILEPMFIESLFNTKRIIINIDKKDLDDDVAPQYGFATKKSGRSRKKEVTGIFLAKTFAISVGSGNKSVGELTNLASTVVHMLVTLKVIKNKMNKKQKLSKTDLDNLELIQDAIKEDLLEKTNSCTFSESYESVLYRNDIDGEIVINVNKASEYEILSKAIKMDVSNIDNLIAYLHDLDIVYRRYQELIIDAAKKAYVVHVLFAPGKHCSSLALEEYTMNKTKDSVVEIVTKKNKAKKISDPLGLLLNESIDAAAKELNRCYDLTKKIELCDKEYNAILDIYEDNDSLIRVIKELVVGSYRNNAKYSNEEIDIKMEDDFKKSLEELETFVRKNFKSFNSHIANTYRLLMDFIGKNDPVFMARLLNAAARVYEEATEYNFSEQSKAVTNICTQEYLVYLLDRYSKENTLDASGYGIVERKQFGEFKLQDGDYVILKNGQNSVVSTDSTYTGTLRVMMTESGHWYVVKSIAETIDTTRTNMFVLNLKPFAANDTKTVEEIRTELSDAKIVLGTNGSVSKITKTDKGAIEHKTLKCLYKDGGKSDFAEFFKGLTGTVKEVRVTDNRFVTLLLELDNEKTTIGTDKPEKTIERKTGALDLGRKGGKQSPAPVSNNTSSAPTISEDRMKELMGLNKKEVSVNQEITAPSTSTKKVETTNTTSTSANNAETTETTSPSGLKKESRTFNFGSTNKSKSRNTSAASETKVEEPRRVLNEGDYAL